MSRAFVIHTPPITTSRLGLGLAAVARPAYITPGRADSLGSRRSIEDLRTRTHQLLDTAYQGGIRYLDVARSYGCAEEFLGSWFHNRPSSGDVMVGSKWGYRYVGDWQVDAGVHEVKDHSLAAFTEQLAQTRTLLGEHLAVYHIHSATPHTGVLDDQALLRALADLAAEGVRVGISTSGHEQARTVRQALGITADGQPLFTSFQTTWNPLEPSAGAVLQEAADQGARVIVKEAVANGRLAPRSDDTSPGVRRARTLATRLGIGIDQLAIAAALAQPWTWRVLSGAVTPEQLTSNLAAATLDLPHGWLTELRAIAEQPQDYWTQRSARPWT